MKRIVLTGVAAICGCITALAIATTVYELSLPGVADARERVAAIALEHGGEVEAPPLPARLVDSIVAVEDEHFFSNIFAEVALGVARAAIASIHTSGDPGGSTIPQQLAKQLYPHGSGFGGSVRELAIGIKLSLRYSKDEVMSMYLTAVYFGNQFWGDRAAAEGYFGTSPSKLSWAQASLLAGLLQAPSRYNPVEHLSLAKLRQRHVLDQLVANHYLTPSEGDAAYRENLALTGLPAPGIRERVPPPAQS